MTDEPQFNAHVFRSAEKRAKATVSGDAIDIHMALSGMFGHHSTPDWQGLCAVAPASVTLPTGHRVYIDPA